VTGKLPRTGEAATVAESMNQSQRTVDTRWTRTYARQLPLALFVHRCCDADIIRSGSDEFRRIGVAGWINEQQIPEHSGDRLARDLDQALTGTRHG
jgi:hypothetical protein